MLIKIGLKIFFKRRATERSEFAKELRTEALKYGEIPEDLGSFKGTANRNWMSLKSMFSTNNEEVILEEAIRGEKASLEEYNKLITEKNLPRTIDELILRHTMPYSRPSILKSSRGTSVIIETKTSLKPMQKHWLFYVYNCL